MGVAHFYACANPLTLLIIIFSLRAMCWYHDSTERVLGSKSLENELLWTSVNVLVVSPVVQIKGSIIVCATNKLPKLYTICASLNKCSTFVQETPVIHLQQSRITPLRSFPASKFKAHRPCHVMRGFLFACAKCATPT